MSDKMDRRRLLSHAACGFAGAALAWAVPRWRWSAPSAAAQESTDTPEGRLKRLKLELPRVTPSKSATLVPTVRVGEMLYVSGHIPIKDGKPMTGKVGKDVELKVAQVAARQIGLTILSVVRGELGTLDKVVRLVKTLGMVNCTPEFTQQPQVINAFSDLMVQVFGEKAGKGARSAVGMVSLPLGVPVEIECIFQVKT